MRTDDRNTLLAMLAEHAYHRDPDGFWLASGVKSEEYLDCKLALSQPEAIRAVGNLTWRHLQGDVQAVGGLTMGADPIAIATSVMSVERSHKVRWFAVRKEPKSHGRQQWIAGSVEQGESVAVVDDVVTSGGSTIQAIARCREEGLRVAQVIVVVDRQEQEGIEKIRAQMGGNPVTALVTKSEVREVWEQSRVSRATA